MGDDGGGGGGDGFGSGGAGGAFPTMAGDEHPPGPGIPYGWILVLGGVVALAAVLGAIATGNPFVLVWGVIGIVLIAFGIGEQRGGTCRW